MRSEEVWYKAVRNLPKQLSRDTTSISSSDMRQDIINTNSNSSIHSENHTENNPYGSMHLDAFRKDIESISLNTTTRSDSESEDDDDNRDKTAVDVNNITTSDLKEIIYICNHANVVISSWDHCLLLSQNSKGVNLLIGVVGGTSIRTVSEWARGGSVLSSEDFVKSTISLYGVKSNIINRGIVLAQDIVEYLEESTKLVSEIIVTGHGLSAFQAHLAVQRLNLEVLNKSIKGFCYNCSVLKSSVQDILPLQIVDTPNIYHFRTFGELFHNIPFNYECRNTIYLHPSLEAFQKLSLNPCNKLHRHGIDVICQGIMNPSFTDDISYINEVDKVKSIQLDLLLRDPQLL